jgi:tetratricopeptide (TPR) repeat protein
MTETAKILRFPTPAASPYLSLGEAEVAARTFLSFAPEEWSEESNRSFLGSADVLMALCRLLGQQRDTAPAVVASHAEGIYRWISRSDCECGLFDERDYFLGQMALLAGIATRHLGRREEAFRWLDRAEAGFRHTLNPAPGLANVAYARLALRFEMGRYDDVLELVPSLESSFTKLRMSCEAAKCRLLRAMTLKQLGENVRAVELLQGLDENPSLAEDRTLRSRILAEVGDLHQLEGRLDLAISALKHALDLLNDEGRSAARADLQLFVGGVLHAKGSLREAHVAFGAARSEYLALDMKPQATYLNLVIAETLIALGRPREAEWEILSALPAIDEMKMAPEAVAAVSLLRESVRRRETDPLALQHVKERIQSGQ